VVDVCGLDVGAAEPELEEVGKPTLPRRRDLVLPGNSSQRPR
jgi:hypothetical protein